MSTIILRALDDSLGIGHCEIPEGRAQTDVGRSADCAIVLPSKSVSRVHARFERKGTELVLQDLGSSNGTSLNGKPIQEPVTVHAGDRVRFGSLEFVLEEKGAPEDEAATLLAPRTAASPAAPAATSAPTAPSPSTSELTPSPTPLTAESVQPPEPTPTVAPPARGGTSKTVAKVREPATSAPAVTPARAAPTPSGPARPFELAVIAIGAYVAVVAAGLTIRWVLG
jgi:pSer/pThr/pTyr-binding forkhead associated (FHA) protein